MTRRAPIKREMPSLVSTNNEDDSPRSESDEESDERSLDAPKDVDAVVELVATDSLSTVAGGEILRRIKDEDVKKHLPQTSEDHSILTQNWRSRQQAIDSIKYHSTKKGKRVLVDRKSILRYQGCNEVCIFVVRRQSNSQ